MQMDGRDYYALPAEQLLGRPVTLAKLTERQGMQINKYRFPLTITAVVVATLLVAQPVSAQLSMTDLGTLGGIFSNAIAINERGQVVGGSSLIAPGQFHAVLWTK
jgi:probable HAF family extracellular repeat protein